MKVTIKEIAQEAGVSMNAVSRALNGKDGVNKATREKILRIANELNYVPNQFAKGLRSRKSNIIGVVVTNIANPFYSEIIKVAEGIARKTRYDLVLYNSSEDQEQEMKILAKMRMRFVDGILITPVNTDVDTIQRLKDTGIPFVVMNRDPEDRTDVSYVVNDDVGGAYLAAKHLCERGVSVIHYLGGPKEMYTVRQRIKGCYQGIAEFPDTSLIVHSIPITLEESYKATKRIVREAGNTRIGIFAYNDNLAIGAMKAIRELGKRIPQDVALIGYDDILFASMLEVPLTTIRQSSTEIGMQATQLLMEKLKKKDFEDRHVILDPELIVRGST